MHDFPLFATDPTANVIKTSLFLGSSIGGITFSGSLIAYGKLQGILGSTPLLLPGRHAINMGLLAGNLASMAYFFYDPSMFGGLASLSSATAFSAALGLSLTSSIGGNYFIYTYKYFFIIKILAKTPVWHYISTIKR